jgi:hypothetical protein
MEGVGNRMSPKAVEEETGTSLALNEVVLKPVKAGVCSGGPKDELRLGIAEAGLEIEPCIVPALRVEVVDNTEGAGVTAARGGTFSEMGKPRSFKTFSAT